MANKLYARAQLTQLGQGGAPFSGAETPHLFALGGGGSAGGAK